MVGKFALTLGYAVAVDFTSVVPGEYLLDVTHGNGRWKVLLLGVSIPCRVDSVRVMCGTGLVYWPTYSRVSISMISMISIEGVRTVVTIVAVILTIVSGRFQFIDFIG